MASFIEEIHNTTIHNPVTSLCEQVLLACERGKFEFFEEYLQNNTININEQDCNGSTALHFAVAQNNVKCVDVLLKQNAYPNIKDECGCSPLLLSVGRYPNSSVAELLLNSGADINGVNNWGNTALHSAVYSEDIHCVQLLLKRGADVNIKNKKDQSVSDVAEERENSEISSILSSVNNVQCSHCLKKPEDVSTLKMCTGCKTAQYCDKECQRLDWKNGHKQLCSGYVVTSFVLKPANPSDFRKLCKKKFIVKVQVPLNMLSQPTNGDMMVYNRNKTFLHLLNSTNQEKAVKILTDKIKKDGILGAKAYFWAEIDPKNEKAVKIFYREPTAFQDW